MGEDTCNEEYEILDLLDEYGAMMSIEQIVAKLGSEEELVRRCVSELEKKRLVNTQDGKVCVNKEVKIRDMLNCAEIDSRVLKEYIKIGE